MTIEFSTNSEKGEIDMVSYLYSSGFTFGDVKRTGRDTCELEIIEEMPSDKEVVNNFISDFNSGKAYGNLRKYSQSAHIVRGMIRRAK